MKKLTAALIFLFGFSPVALSDDSLFIDVRSAEEFARGHIRGALLMPHDQIAGLIASAGIPRETPITLYCRSGRRSEMAKETLVNLGYTNVTNGGGYEQLAQQRPSECAVDSC